jgi:alpha-galactosidase
MKALADYVHSRGLKIGIYSGPGTKTCGGYTASLGHEEQDAQLYASWGIDYLKYDLCSFIPDVMEKQAPNDKAAQMRLMVAAYDKMSKALKAAGRPIVFSLCQYGWDAPWEWAPALGGNSWRTTGDIDPHWDRVYAILSQQAGLEKYAGPGHWNDPDMLEVGNGDLTLAENRAHFSMWAMLASPLLAGNDLPNMKPEISAILTNRDVIAIDQDKLGKQASRTYTDGEVEVWTRHLSGGAMAIAVLAAGDNRFSTHPFHLSLAKLGLHGPQQAKDLWTGKEMQLLRSPATTCCWSASPPQNRTSRKRLGAPGPDFGTWESNNQTAFRAPRNSTCPLTRNSPREPCRLFPRLRHTKKEKKCVPPVSRRIGAVNPFLRRFCSQLQCSQEFSATSTR